MSLAIECGSMYSLISTRTSAFSSSKRTFANDLASAEEYLESIKEEITVDPIQSGVYGMLASIYMNREEYEEALAYYLAAEKLTSLSDFKIKYEIGQIIAFQALEKHDRAVRLSKKILEIENLKYSYKNKVEELLAFSTQIIM